MTATIAGVATAVHAVPAPPAEKVSPGLLGFIVVFALALATWLLLRSMVGHMRKVRFSPEPGQEPGTGPGAQQGGGTDGEGDAGKPPAAGAGEAEGSGTPAGPGGNDSAG